MDDTKSALKRFHSVCVRHSNLAACAVFVFNIWIPECGAGEAVSVPMSK